MAYSEITALLETMVTLEQLQEKFHDLAKEINLEMPMLRLAQRFDLFQRLLDLTPLFLDDDQLKKQFNDVFQETIIARYAGLDEGDENLFLFPDQRSFDIARYFHPEDSEKPWEPLQLGYPYESDPLNTWHFIHQLKNATLLTVDNFSLITQIVRNFHGKGDKRERRLHLSEFQYGVEILAKAKVLSQDWLSTFKCPVPGKENLDWLYYRLQQSPDIDMQKEYKEFARYPRDVQIVISLLLRLFNSPTHAELAAIIKFSQFICIGSVSTLDGQKGSLVLQNLLRRNLLDKTNCTELFKLDMDTAKLLLCHDLSFLIQEPHEALTKERFTMFLGQKYPGKRMAAFCALARRGLSIDGQDLHQGTISALAMLSYHWGGGFSGGGAAIRTTWRGAYHLPITRERLERLLLHTKLHLFINVLTSLPADLLIDSNIDKIEHHQALDVLLFFFHLRFGHIKLSYFNHVLQYTPILDNFWVQEAIERIPYAQRTDAFYEEFFQACERLQALPLEEAQEVIVEFLHGQLGQFAPRDEAHEQRPVFANTHTATIHQTASTSAQMLMENYGHLIKTPDAANRKLNEIQSDHHHLVTLLSMWRKTDKSLRTQDFLNEKLALLKRAKWLYEPMVQTPEDVNELLEKLEVITKSKTPIATKDDIATDALDKIINSIYGEHLDPKSGVDVSTLLALIWIAINDEPKRIGTLKDATMALINGLYDLAREGNLDMNGVDLGGQTNSFSCPPGAFNKLIESMVGILPDAQQTYVSKDSISVKYQRIVAELILKHLTDRLNSIQTQQELDDFNALLTNLEKDGIDDNVWSTLKPLAAEELWAAFTVNVSKEALRAFTMLFPGGKANQEYRDFVDSGRHINVSESIKTTDFRTTLPEKNFTEPDASDVPEMPPEPQQPIVQPYQRAVHELNKIQSLLTDQIQGLRWNLFALFFRSYQTKRLALIALRAKFEEANPAVTGQTVRDVVLAWKTPDVFETIQMHRNRFFSKTRPGVKTNTEQLIDTIEAQYGHCRLS